MKQEFEKSVLDEGFDPDREKAIDLIKKNIIPEVVIHGTEIIDKKGERKLAPRTDIDAQIAVYLLSLAGVEYNVTAFVEKGESRKGAINIDTGEKSTLTFEDETQTIYFDHHGEKRAKRFEYGSSTEMVYRTLLRADMLKDEPWLEELVIFVNEVDNQEFVMNREMLEDQWWRSFYGLHKLLSFESLINLFKEGRRSDHLFTADEAREIKVKDKKGKNVSLYDLCVTQRKFVNGNIETVETMYANPYIEGRGRRRFDLNTEGVKKTTKELGTVLTNIVGKQNKMPLGFTLARAMDFDSYVSFFEDNGGFFISSLKRDIPGLYQKLKEKYPEVKLIRGTMIIFNPEKAEGAGQTDPRDFLTTIGLLE